MHDSGEPAGHESEGRVSDHDGFVRIFDADRQLTLHSVSGVFDAGGARPDVGGVPGVLIAAYIIKSLPLVAVRWLVVVVVLYAAIAMLRSAAKRNAHATSEEELVAVP